MNKAKGIIESIAAKYALYYLDLYEKFSELGLPRHNEDLFIKNIKNSGRADGVHPTALGYYFISTHIHQLLQDEGLTDKKIVCFGDSITFGGGPNNSKGLVIRNYPSYLEQLLN